MYRKLNLVNLGALGFISWFCANATRNKVMGGKRLTKEQVEEIRHRSIDLHESERVIAMKMGKSKSAVHRVLTNPQIQGFQNPEQSFGPFQEAHIAIEGLGRTPFGLADSALSHLEGSRQRAVAHSDSTKSSSDFRATAEDLMRLVLQSGIGIRADAIEPFMSVFMQDLPEFLAYPQHLQSEMHSHFGPIAGKLAFEVFIGFRPKLLSMRVIQLSRSYSTVALK